MQREAASRDHQGKRSDRRGLKLRRFSSIGASSTRIVFRIYLNFTRQGSFPRLSRRIDISMRQRQEDPILAIYSKAISCRRREIAGGAGRASWLISRADGIRCNPISGDQREFLTGASRLPSPLPPPPSPAACQDPGLDSVCFAVRCRGLENSGNLARCGGGFLEGRKEALSRRRERKRKGVDLLRGCN